MHTLTFTPLHFLFQTKLPKDDSYKQEWHDANDDPQELGLNISNEQLEEMRGQLDNIDFQEAAAEERKVAIIKMKFQAVADKNYPHAVLAGAARRDGARAHVRGGLPLGGGHHPPWRHLVLRWGQRRPDRAQVETKALSFLATRCSSPETALTC